MFDSEDDNAYNDNDTKDDYDSDSSDKDDDEDDTNAAHLQFMKQDIADRINKDIDDPPFPPQGRTGRPNAGSLQLIRTVVEDFIKEDSTVSDTELRRQRRLQQAYEKTQARRLAPARFIYTEPTHRNFYEDWARVRTQCNGTDYASDFPDHCLDTDYDDTEYDSNLQCFLESDGDVDYDNEDYTPVH